MARRGGGRAKNTGGSGRAVQLAIREARADSGNTFWGSSGLWAGQQFSRALRSGRRMDTGCLRTNDVLSKDEWVHFDEAVVSEVVIRTRAVGDLLAAGLSIPIPNALGKTLMQWEKITDMEAAGVSLSGLYRTEDDRPEVTLDSLPLPIVHKDFNINLRTIEASRERGEPLDTLSTEMATRKVVEKLEDMLFNGGPQFGGAKIYGLLTHPNINTVDFENNEEWTNASKDGAGILVDVLNGVKALKQDGYHGPYWMYTSLLDGLVLENDFKANGDKSIRSRLLEIPELQRIETVDVVPTGSTVIFQATKDVVAIANGFAPRTVQWDQYGGFQTAFKVLAIQVPLVRATAAGKSGIVVIKQL